LNPSTAAGIPASDPSLNLPYLSIVIPVYNEADRIGASLDSLSRWIRQQPAPVELIVVDDGSGDATPAVARTRLAAIAGSRLIELPHRGKANAVMAGLSATTGRIVGFMDIDLATPLDTWATCESEFKDGADVVIGSREGHGAVRVGEPAYRHAMGRVFNAVVRLLLLPGIHDTQCGFKFFTREAATSILPRCRLYAGAAQVSRPRVTAFDVELLYIAWRLDLRIRVVPVHWTYGEHTKVHPITDTLQNARDVLAVRWNGWRGHYS
jgi:glycosyltransferase involved in cell wall biosynthesis